MVNDVSTPSGISSTMQAVNFIAKPSIGERFMSNFLSFPYFLFFSGFHHDFVIYIDFTHVAASNTATDDVTN